MKITICGSIAFFDEMLRIKVLLEKMSHEIRIPPTSVVDENGNPMPVKHFYDARKAETSDTSYIWDRKKESMENHFRKVEWSDAILILNYDKSGIEGYIGANTLMEMGLALHLGKKIFLLNKIPEMQYKEEILGMKPMIINGNLELIK